MWAPWGASDDEKHVESNSLVEVQVAIDFGSLESSSQSVPIEPCFDPSIGLYSIRPKILKDFFVCKSSRVAQNFISICGSFSRMNDECVLVNVGPSTQGGSFTWSNFREHPSFSRLDRLLQSPEILSFWPDLTQILLPKNISDHNPIRLSFLAKGWGPRPFQWFEYLVDNPDYVKEFTKVSETGRSNGIGNLLRNCKRASKVWVSNKLGNAGMTIQKLEIICAEIEEAISQGDHDPRLLTELKSCRQNSGKTLEEKNGSGFRSLE
ncbi:hypothetical protein V6N13_124507 [Hibiscus sabdariffa]